MGAAGWVAASFVLAAVGWTMTGASGVAIGRRQRSSLGIIGAAVLLLAMHCAFVAGKLWGAP